MAAVNGIVLLGNLDSKVILICNIDIVDRNFMKDIDRL